MDSADGARAEWLRARGRGVGASEAAAVVGLSPYKTNVELWEEKTGRREPEDIGGKPYVQYGTQAEAHLRALFSLDFPEYEVRYDPFGMISNNPNAPFAFATLDGELIEKATGRRGVLEIKTTEIMRSGQWDNWNGQVPQHYYIQNIHQLMATGYDFLILKAQIKAVQGGELKIHVRHYPIERAGVLDDIDYLQQKEIEFWKCVQENRPPPLILPEIQEDTYMEFKVETDLAVIPQIIEFNFDELHAYVSENIKAYKDLVLTEDTLREGKARKADLNRLKTALEDARKGVKAQCLAPYSEFEAKVKNLTGMVDDAVQSIDVQIKAFDQQRRDEKYAEIEAFYRDHIGELAQLLPIEKVLCPKWGNVTAPVSQVTEEMEKLIVRAGNDLKLIDAMNLPSKQQMIDGYLRKLDMADAMAEKLHYEQRQKQLAEMEEQRAQEAHQPSPQPQDAPPAEKASPIDFRVWATPAQLSALKRFLIENRIKYGRVQ